MLCGSFFFALMATLTHALRDDYDWQVIAFARGFLALVFALALARAAGVKLVLWRPHTLWMRSIAGSVSMVCTFYSFPRLPVADVLTLTNTFPIWVAVLSWPVLQEAPPPQVWVSVACSVLGVALIQQPNFARGNYTALIALVASVATAFAMMGLHRLHGIDARAIVVHFSAVSLFFCGTAYFLCEHTAPTHHPWSARPLLMLLGVGVAATVGQLFLTKAFAAGSPAKVSVVGLTQVVFALVFNVFEQEQVLDAGRLAGIALVTAPTAWMMLSGAGGAVPVQENV